MNEPLQATAVAPIELRRAASRFATGVALVTAPGGLALVIDSFLSVSLQPPLIAFAPSRTSLTWRSMRLTGRFGVSVLDAAHARDIRERARPGADRLAGLDIELLDGVPVVQNALAALVCALEAEHLAGDHSIVLGRVLAIRHGDDRPPLVFFSGDFCTIHPTKSAVHANSPRQESFSEHEVGIAPDARAG
jgi:3-hydroxy-9,10-secoandrosta-1,3,5(10)-triene-9,17-dione monooxygenase reductase component